jgi:carboxypeptidase C (cathepsin A)
VPARLRFGASFAATFWLFCSLALAQPAAQAPGPDLRAATAGAAASHAGTEPPGSPDHAVHAAPAEDRNRLPPDATTHHSLALPGRTLNFTATAGAIRLYEDDKPEVAIAYVAYKRDGTDPANRPVTFVMNGGPGMASAWLQLGALGPWRLPLDPQAISPSVSPAVIDNADTWLDFTDLVFIDPAGTGYSRFIDTGEEVHRRLWSVEGDVDAAGQFIRRWLEANDRLLSPKFFVGESYGGFRGPKLVRDLQSEHGIGISGLILLSPALDLEMLTDDDSPLWWTARLPSMVAAARAARGPVSRAALADAEDYATGDYLHALLHGPHDPAELDRLSARLADLTELDPALLRRRGGRLGTRTFLREFYRAQGRVASPYDATVTSPNPDPSADAARYADPILQGLNPPLTSAMVEVYARRLNWRPDGDYRLSNQSAYDHWNFGHGMAAPESLGSLAQALALDQRLRVLVEHGLTDLVTPYFGTQILLDQLPDFGPDRVRLLTHEGGHMFYLRDDSRAALRQEVRGLIGGG